MAEGNLQAPTRHPIAWKSPEFHDETRALAEMERVFDICHGCRRCVSLCASFPTLFDLVDATADGEVHGVAKADYARVVDQCYLCDLCYMTKCPYTPPHPWNVDFPHLMLRAKAIKFRHGGVGVKERFLASTDVHGSLAGIPVVVEVVNAVNRAPAARKLLDSQLGVHPDAWLPPLAGQRFRWGRAMNNTAHPAVRGQRTPGRVALFATCFVDHHEPVIGDDLVKLLDHNEIPYEIVRQEECCGMPKLELGDLESVERAWRANVPVLARYAREGWAIVSPIPSCTLMFKQGTATDVSRRCRHGTRPGCDVRSLRVLHRAPQGRSAEDRLQGRAGQGRLSHPVSRPGAEHRRKTEEMFKLIGTRVEVVLTTVERCSGHAGTYGVKTATHSVAMKIGKPVFKAMAAAVPDVISSDCALAGHHIAQGMAQAGAPAPALRHPLSLMRIAYGLE